jgi:hypothetical protein
MSWLTVAEQSADPSAPSSGKAKLWVDDSPRPKFKHMDDLGNVRFLLDDSFFAGSVADQTGFAADTYLAGSAVAVKAGAWRVASQYRCSFDMVKTAAGVAAFTANIRMGTAGAITDTSVLSLAFAIGTAAVDTGWFDIEVNFRTVGGATAAVIKGIIKCSHHLAATGLITTGASGFGMILGTSAGFNSTTQTFIGVSINGGTSFAGTNTMVKSSLVL